MNNVTHKIDIIDVFNETIITKDMRVVTFKEDADGNRVGLNVNLPSATYRDGHIAFDICSTEGVNFMVSELFKGFGILQEEMETGYLQQLINVTQMLLDTEKTAKDAIQLYKELVNKYLAYKEDTEKIHAQNKEYEEWYGKYINPTQILEELYNGNRVGECQMMIVKEDWKSKLLKRNTTGVRFWLSFMEEIGIFQAHPKGQRIALMTKDKAKKLLMEKRNVK